MTLTVAEKLETREKVDVTESLPCPPLVNVGILLNVLEAEILNATVEVADGTVVEVNCIEAVL